MKRRLCILCCVVLTLAMLSCAAAEAGELPTATALKAYLPTVDWEDYTARDTDGDGFDDEIMISYGSGGRTDSDTIDVYAQCMDGAVRVFCVLARVPADADPLKVYEQVNEFNDNLNYGRWAYDEAQGYVYYAQEVYAVEGVDVSPYVHLYMESAASYVYSFHERFAAAIQ